MTVLAIFGATGDVGLHVAKKALAQVFLFLGISKVAPMYRAVTADRQKMLDVLKASGLKWVAVLPPYFTYGRGGRYVVTEGSSPGDQIAVEDLSAFLVESLTKPEYYNKVLGIANTS